MKRTLSSFSALGFVALLSLRTASARADNPIVQHLYTADPAPLVVGDTVYLYTSHDEDVTVNNFFTMNDWYVFSSKDMVNWTDHGSPLGYESFSWATGQAWAPHAATRDGKYYLYVPVAPNSIGVAVSDSPIGPFTDPLDRALVTGSYQYIDPTVFVDDDGQAYLYFGNPKLWYVRLNDDMISYSGSITEVPNTTAAFGQRTGNPDRPTLYEEGPWFYRRGDLYYMMYAASGIPEDIAYSTSSSPTGPWTYRGIIMENEAGHAFTNHAGVIDFRGRSFFFYHTQELPGGGGFKRSSALEEFTYNADGSFPTIRKTSAGVTESVEPLIPFYRTEGETIAWGSGVEVEDCSEGGRNLSQLENGDFVKVESVDFLTGAIAFEASVASGSAGGTIELRLDAVDGALIGTVTVSATGGWQMWQTVSTEVTGAVGVHDLYLVFKGGSGSLFNLDHWIFTPKDPLPVGTGGMSGLGGESSGAGGAVVGTGGAPVLASGGAPATGGAGGGLATDDGGCACSTVLGRARETRGGMPWAFGALFAGVAAARLGRRRRSS